MFKINYNIISENHKKRIAVLSNEKRNRYENYLKNESKENLLVLKKSSIIPEVGDIFILSLKDGEYYYGKVLESFKKNETNEQVIVISAKTIREIDINNCNFDYENLLFTPKIVYDGYWKKGFFKKIANIPLTTEEKNLDYGFFKMHPLNEYGYFVNSIGEKLDHLPKYYSSYGVSNIYHIYFAILFENLFFEE